MLLDLHKNNNNKNTNNTNNTNNKLSYQVQKISKEIISTTQTIHRISIIMLCAAHQTVLSLHILWLTDCKGSCMYRALSSTFVQVPEENSVYFQ